MAFKSTSPMATLTLGAACVAYAGLCGCSRNNGELIDSLRRNLITLEDRVRDLEMTNAELRAEIAHLSRADDPQLTDIRQFIPRVVRITIDRLSHAVDTTGDHRADRLIVYLSPTDGRARFVPIVGNVNVSVLEVDANESRNLGGVQLGPAAVREAYRSGLTGTHYRIEVPLDADALRDATKSAVVHAEFADGLTGLVHTAHHTIDLTHVRQRLEDRAAGKEPPSPHRQLRPQTSPPMTDTGPVETGDDGGARVQRSQSSPGLS